MKKKTYAIRRDHQELGFYLSSMRAQAGLTQREVADALGYSSGQYVSNFERGIAVPPLNKLNLMVKMYGLSVEHLCELIVEAERKRLALFFAKTKAPNKRYA